MEIQNITEKKDGSVVFEVGENGERWEEELKRASATQREEEKIVTEQAAEEVLSNAVAQVCEEHGYCLIATPEFTVLEANAEELSALVKLIVYPRVNDFAYLGLAVKKPVKKVSEAEIDAAVKQYMEIHPWVREVERGAQMGDLVDVSFMGTCGGEPFPYDHSDQSRFRMGSETLFAGLDEALVGHVAGDDLELTLTMPETFPRKAIRGRTLDLQVHLKGVSAREDAACTDEYVKAHVKGAQTVKEFRELQRTRLQRTNDSRSEQAFERNLLKALADLVTCPVPDCMVDVSVEEDVRTLTKLGMQQGQTLEQTLKARGQTLEQFKRQVRPGALTRVKASIALDYIMNRENPKIAQEDIEQKIRNQMLKTGLSRDEAIKSLGGEENVAEKLRQEKVYSLVREHCQVEEVEVKRL